MPPRGSKLTKVESPAVPALDEEVVVVGGLARGAAPQVWTGIWLFRCAGEWS